MNGRRGLNWVAIISTLLIVSGAIDTAVGLIVFGAGAGDAPAALAGNRGILGLTFVGVALGCLVVSYGFRQLRTWAWTPAAYLSALNLFVAWIAVSWPGLQVVAVVLVAVAFATIVAMFRPGVAAAFRPPKR